MASTTDATMSPGLTTRGTQGRLRIEKLGLTVIAKKLAPESVSIAWVDAGNYRVE